MATLKRRLREILARTDLWSDEIVILRTIQTLAVLDVHHYCDMVWKLGRYDELEFHSSDEVARLPFVANAPKLPTINVSEVLETQ